MSTVSHHTEREDMVVSQDDHALYLLRYTLLLSLSRTIVLDTDFTALWLHLYSMSSLLFSCQAPSSFSLPSPFCRRNNETASAAIALRMINLRKCVQLFVNNVF